jgi:hypothetical protein
MRAPKPQLRAAVFFGGCTHHALPNDDPAVAYAWPLLGCVQPILTENLLAKTNYSFEKRQREIAKKKKQEEKQEAKRQRKTLRPDTAETPAPGDPAQPPTEPTHNS